MTEPSPITSSRGLDMNARDFSAEVFICSDFLRSSGGAEPNLEDLDEILFLFSHIGGHPEARNKLLVRHYSRIRQSLHKLNKLAHLSADDLDDACQEAVFWTVEAIEKYDLYRLFELRPHRFQQFLDLVIKSRFANFVRALTRCHKHYRHRHAENSAVAPAAESRGSALESFVADTILTQAVAQLPTTLREIVSAVSSGQSLHDLALTQHLSYRTVRRRWQEAREVLRSQIAQQSRQKR